MFDNYSSYEMHHENCISSKRKNSEEKEKYFALKTHATEAATSKFFMLKPTYRAWDKCRAKDILGDDDSITKRKLSDSIHY